MCTNRALTDLYAFSARFIQLLNRKLAYVCIADYYKSEQNVLFCLTLEAVLISFDKFVKHDLDECNLYHSFCGFSKEFVIDGQPSEVFQP